MGPYKRKRPVLAVTVEAEVFAWVHANAAIAHLRPSQWVSSYLAKRMSEEEVATRTPLGKLSRRESAGPGTACRDGAHCRVTV
jgi:hypothetical protein